jgi:hypothetical protein
VTRASNETPVAVVVRSVNYVIVCLLQICYRLIGQQFHKSNEFRCKKKTVGLLMKIERLDAKRVSRANKTICSLVEYRKGKHSP